MQVLDQLANGLALADGEGSVAAAAAEEAVAAEGLELAEAPKLPPLECSYETACQPSLGQ